MAKGKRAVLCLLIICFSTVFLLSFRSLIKSGKENSSQNYFKTTVYEESLSFFQETSFSETSAEQPEETETTFLLSETEKNNNEEIYSEIPVLSCPNEVNLYLNHCLSQGKAYADFVYSGEGSEIRINDLAQMTCSYYVQASALEKVENGIRVEFFKYPGEKIFDYYQKGRISELSKEETETFNAACELLQEEMGRAKSEIELEIAIHDKLCEKISYVECTEKIPDSKTIVRPLTAVGALLDGKANCQGYADAFYLLASLAGFNVGKQSTDDHIFNTISLGGKWYIVDVTFNDGSLSKYKGINSYYLFNAGLDKSGVYTLNENKMRFEISETSDEYYFYNLTSELIENSYQRCFENLDDAAVSVLLENSLMKRKAQHIMIKNKTLTTIDLSRALNKLIEESGEKLKYSVKVLRRDGDTYFYIEFR